ncbi:ABC transporter permease [Sediminitomix flava]|uniref:ABC-type lipoprotein release transport system permease subunit n=1 Tax=Sediminitomix flava TaxID=379075 RepID=A0A315ZIQ5_SEDFL|nr:FtsX-like permease family protein [Sediminitomix flava]PWJ44584.1 ABC-type lipoprotein release transport system permease subunit [Sediminitomix flava]
MLAVLSWRNVWRNKTRSSVIITAVAVGITLTALGIAFIEGMMQQSILNGIKNSSAHIQIHQKTFLQSKEIKYQIKDADPLIEKLKQQEEVVAISERVISTGVAASAHNSLGVQINGVNTETERNFSGIAENIIDGDYFDTKMRRRQKPVVISKRLADKLKLKIRSKLILTMQDKDNELVGMQFKVVGIFQTASQAFDEGNVFVRQHDLEELLKVDGIHEIAIMLKDMKQVPAMKAKIEHFVSSDDLVETWKEAQPELAVFAESMGFTNAIIIMIFMMGVTFGIMNTMLMAVFERTREIGTLMAVGMKKIRIVKMVILETLFLTGIGGLIGLGLGLLSTSYFHYTGIDLSIFGEGMASFGFDTIVRPSLSPETIFGITLAIIATALISAIYPAIKAIKLKPVEAIRTH